MYTTNHPSIIHTSQHDKIITIGQYIPHQFPSTPLTFVSKNRLPYFISKNRLTYIISKNRQTLHHLKIDRTTSYLKID